MAVLSASVVQTPMTAKTIQHHSDEAKPKKKPAEPTITVAQA